jgi:G6PDH family F420-dependent oxidoreductase
VFLSSEEHGPASLLQQARLAESVGMRSAVISDHYHPWIDRQGQSPFVWSVIGGIAASTSLAVTTAVTCPIMRLHPAVIAQAAATSNVMLGGRFRLGVGTGEALNEHILADRWPSAPERIAMLEEAVEVMRKLWGGSTVNHDGRYFKVVDARIYTRTEEPPPVLISAFGPDATSLAARIGDGFVGTSPASGLLDQYRKEGGKGPRIAAVKVCWAPTEEEGRRTAFEMWPTTGVPGQLSQDLPTPFHFQQASSLVEEGDVAEKVVCGPDPEQYVKTIGEYADAGYEEIFIAQIGPNQREWFEFYAKEVSPRLG